MNFLDTYDIASPSSSTETPQVEQSLNEEVNQVVGQLSRFWGGFRKQSQAAFEAAKKDLTQAVSQAQNEITKLTEVPGTAPSSRDASQSEGTASEEPASDEPERQTEQSRDSERSTSSDSSTSQGGHTPSASQSFFSRLQTSLPPNLVSAVQNHVPEAFKQPGSIDLTQLRTNLTSEFQRVQGITRAQAEEYVHKSESLLREAQELLKDAVKVIPPEHGGAVPPAGTLWDGMDIWMLPEPAPSSPKGKGKEKERASTSSGRPSMDGLRAVATRAEALLKQLRHDPEVLKVDPSADERASLLYEAWKKDKVNTKDGDVSGPEWKAAIQTALDDPTDGQALKATKDILVPSHVTEEEFWMRYLFRVHQVEQEEERRKALIQGTVENEEDFSWEDDEEEVSSPMKAEQVSQVNSAKPAASPSTLKVATEHDKGTAQSSVPELQSRRQSSEDSFDVVSSQVSNNGESKVEKAVKAKQVEDDDSDWE